LIKKLEEERQREKEERKEGLRRRKAEQVLPEKTDEELAAYSATIIKNKGDRSEEIKVPISGGLWTDDDLAELVRLTKKYPGGTVDRWEVIASAMNRNVSEVTFMAYKLKDNVYRIPGETDKLVENINKEVAKKLKTKKTDEISAESQKVWSQEQQKALEAAIQKYPKSNSDDRWQKIANSVPGKTKEECLSRYKYLVEMVKKQKEEEKKKEEEAQAIEQTPVPDPEPEKPEKKNKKNKKENPPAEPQENDDEDAQLLQSKGGKRKNKRKEAKKNADFYYDSSEQDEDD
jgi:DnaJ family protein C protein 1